MGKHMKAQKFAVFMDLVPMFAPNYITAEKGPLSQLANLIDTCGSPG